MRKGNIVITEKGFGKLISREGKTGILKKRWKVKMQDSGKELFFHENELEMFLCDNERTG